MDKHLPGRIRSSTGEKSIHHPFCTPSAKRSNLPSRNQEVSADVRSRRGGGAANENSKRQEYRFGICIKVTKPSHNPRHHFRTFLFLFFPWGFTTPLAFSRDVPRDGEIVIGRVLYPFSAGEGGGYRMAKEQK
ncbi:hypothetical protein CDAR_541481 [Caerostris darwini]|uniref:Uncharacterized protein n=1 Tax=Caerostris darwini TaxID=1538125 RepID=A0AAV4VW80_9ARAC|nr:hypothetical protein CDAR_541481 [Caerostris darwini]